MKQTALVPMLVEGIVTMSTKVAVDGLVKLATPPGVRAVTTFVIKGGAFLLGTYVANKISKVVVKNAEELSTIVKATPVPVITTVDPTPDDS